jgi:hypothetical protein
MRLSFRRSFGGPQRQSSVEANPLRFVLTRIIGNDLPPRHAAGQNLKNIRFILDREPDLSGCSKRWILNRIVNPDIERALIATLDAHHQRYSRIGFRLQAFGRLGRETGLLDGGAGVMADIGGKPTEDARKRALLRAERPRINYAIPINAARNLALLEAHNDADWILPFDGNCFVTEAAWARIRAFVGQRGEIRYVAIAMARISGYEAVFSRGGDRKVEGEPQVMFHHEAPLAFDESYPYGRRDKVELLWRLGVTGEWDRWHDDPFDLPRPKAIAPRPQVATTGWVIRLPSGRAELEEGRAASRRRTKAREEAILRFLGNLDERVRRGVVHSE